jgi:hypothetical protein
VSEPITRAVSVRLPLEVAMDTVPIGEEELAEYLSCSVEEGLLVDPELWPMTDLAEPHTTWKFVDDRTGEIVALVPMTVEMRQGLEDPSCDLYALILPSVKSQLLERFERKQGSILTFFWRLMLAVWLEEQAKRSIRNDERKDDG